MWKKLLITGCMAFCLLGGSVLSAQPSCETKEEVTSEQLNRTKKGLDAMMKELKNNSWYQSELNKVASLATPSEQMRLIRVWPAV